MTEDDVRRIVREEIALADRSLRKEGPDHQIVVEVAPSFDAALFDAAGGDPQQVALAAMRAREELADQILAGEN